MVKTSDRNNLTTGRIAAAHGRYNGRVTNCPGVTGTAVPDS